MRPQIEFVRPRKQDVASGMRTVMWSSWRDSVEEATDRLPGERTCGLARSFDRIIR